MAWIHPKAEMNHSLRIQLGHTVEIGPFAYIGCLPMPTKATRRQPTCTQDVTIGTGTKIGPHACIYAGVEIGEDCLIANGAVIREGVRIGDRCVIGCGVEINYETVIGNDCRIMSQTHLTGRMTVGDGSFFGVGVNTSNDRRIDLADYEYHEEVIVGPKIGAGVVIGTGANLLAGVTISDNAVIAAGALVVKDVPAGAVVKGPIAQVQEAAR
jgi:acetyltransferase-like isoleucine patch superfamily enzyme